VRLCGNLQKLYNKEIEQAELSTINS